jgi:hypothetical protein
LKNSINHLLEVKAIDDVFMTLFCADGISEGGEENMTATHHMVRFGTIMDFEMLVENKSVKDEDTQKFILSQLQHILTKLFDTRTAYADSLAKPFLELAAAHMPYIKTERVTDKATIAGFESLILLGHAETTSDIETLGDHVRKIDDKTDNPFGPFARHAGLPLGRKLALSANQRIFRDQEDKKADPSAEELNTKLEVTKENLSGAERPSGDVGFEECAKYTEATLTLLEEVRKSVLKLPSGPGASNSRHAETQRQATNLLQQVDAIMASDLKFCASHVMVAILEKKDPDQNVEVNTNR